MKHLLGLTAILFHGSAVTAWTPVRPAKRGFQTQGGLKTNPSFLVLGATLYENSEKSAGNDANGLSKTPFKHAIAILAMPYTSLDRIANEKIINAVLPKTDKLSIVLRCESERPPSLARLRRYVGEIYSQTWDCVMYDETPRAKLPDVVVYPQNLPNTAPESWLEIQPDLDAICSHDTLTGWVSEGATGRGKVFQTQEGVGGLEAHACAINSERKQRQLPPIKIIQVDEFPKMLEEEAVIFVDDDPEDIQSSPIWRASREKQGIQSGTICEEEEECDMEGKQTNSGVLLSGARIPLNQQLLYDSVCVGGTFDGLHFGHRKLLTLAVSSVNPLTGRLLIGVTADEMLTKKRFAEYMPSLDERREGVRRFLHRLAPGMMNRVQIVTLSDPFGPPCSDDPKVNKFDALVLSHETLQTGYLMNNYRQEKLGLPPMKLLCTRRTEAQGMSSTALRKMRHEQGTLQKGNKSA
jgi:cytidyltransferase-like protein